jgi:hypothetical protein
LIITVIAHEIKQLDDEGLIVLREVIDILRDVVETPAIAPHAAASGSNLLAD